MTAAQTTSRSDVPNRGVGEGAELTSPPEAILLQLLSAYRIPSLLLQLSKLDIPELLADGPRSVEELARETQLDPDALYRVLRLLASSGIFNEVSPRTFRQTPVSDTLRLLRVLRLELELPRVLETGRSGIELAFGLLPFAYFDQHPAECAVFDRAQRQLIASASGAIATGYDWSGAATVMDVGGGTGELVSAILAASPQLTGVIFERPVVARNAQAAIVGRGLATRCEVIAGDFFQSVPALEADVVVLSHVIHDWDDEHAETILRNTRAAMPRGGRLLVAEAILPPGNEPHPSKEMDVAMLLWGDGRERTLDEYRGLLDSAGLQFSRVISLPSNPLGISLIESVVAGS